jgi:hypothetical protein
MQSCLPALPAKYACCFDEDFVRERLSRGKYSTHRTQREAEVWLAQEISRGASVALTPGRLTVAAYMNHWLADLRDGRSHV